MRTILLALFALGVFCRPVCALSTSKITDVKVTDNGDNTWKVTITGTITIDAKDKFSGFQATVEKDQNAYACFIKYDANPEPGKTVGYTAWVNVSAKGNWTAKTAMAYYLNGKDLLYDYRSANFTVP